MSESSSGPAGLRVRLLAFAFDYLLIAGYLLALVAAGVAVNLFLPSVARALFGSPISGEAVGLSLITVPVALYFAVSESSRRQATWGKARLGLIVTDAAGSRLRFARSLARTVLKFIPWELAHLCIWQVMFAADRSDPIYTVGFIGVWVLLGADLGSLIVSPRRQALHDRLTAALVVKTASDRCARTP